MYLNHKGYYTLNQALKEKFGEKIIKLSIDGGFTCPNRDGTLANRGCLFCSEKGSGEFTSSANTITEQMQQQVSLLSNKWHNAKYLAYFQSFTNTYDSVEELKRKYDEALSFPNVVGLAIATRPDCLSTEILDLLESYSQKTFLWIELGLQTIHEKSASLLRRGYPLSVFDTAIEQLHQRNILTVVHMIINLPNESIEQMRETAIYLSKKKIWGLKIHMLYISSDSDLGKLYLTKPFPLLSREEYIDTVVDILRRISPNIVIHRLTGDGDRLTLLAPHWMRDKRSVLNGIDKKMRAENLLQGDLEHQLISCKAITT